jgi:NAD(P)-dependent dehydrogenase (short-subunit alcohol dehydrogenase family)
VAESVVQEIVSKGGIAVADTNSVVEGDKIIKTAIDKFGRVDILINNAGTSVLGIFSKQDDKGWKATMDSHVFGAYKCTRAAWNIMREQGYGRIVNIGSLAGLYGDHGLSSYSAAKSAVIGFTQSLAIEGVKKNIFANVVAPLADTRMLRALKLNEKLVNLLEPVHCVPLIGYLCHESCKENGGIFECGGGWFTKVRWQRSEVFVALFRALDSILKH